MTQFFTSQSWTTWTTATSTNLRLLPPTPPEGESVMPTRDASGRFTSDAPPKVPIETLPEAVATFEHLIRIMHATARREQLCESYDRSIDSVVDALPFVTYDEASEQPVYRASFSITGYVYAPAESNRLSVGEAEDRVPQELRREYAAWRTEHNVPDSAFQFVAWLTNLPGNRRASVTYDLSGYGDRARGASSRYRPVHLRVAESAVEPAEEKPLDGLTDLMTAAAATIDVPPAPGDRPELAEPEQEPMQFHRCMLNSCDICDAEVRARRDTAAAQGRRLIVTSAYTSETVEYMPDGSSRVVVDA